MSTTEQASQTHEVHPAIAKAVAVAVAFPKYAKGLTFEIELGEDREGSEDYATTTIEIELYGEEVKLDLFCDGEELRVCETERHVAHAEEAVFSILDRIISDAKDEIDEARHEQNAEDWARMIDERDEWRERMAYQSGRV